MGSTTGSPAGAEFEPALLERAVEVVRRGAGTDPREDAYPGAVVAVARGGRLIVKEAVGYAAIAPAPVPMQWEHVFDAASLTKVVATATAILILIERGLLRLEDRLARFFAETRDRPLGRVTIRHLLTHTSGLPGWIPLYEVLPCHRGTVEAIAAFPPGAPPGERVEYSCVGYILLGCLVEKLAGLNLAGFVSREIAAPLGLDDTRYLPVDRPLPAEIETRLVPTEARAGSDRGLGLMGAVRRKGIWPGEWEARHPGGVARGIVHDENAAFLGGVAGNAGLFTTAGDLLAFGQMWLDGGIYGGKRLLGPDTVAGATRNCTPGLGGNQGLGWQLPSPGSFFGSLASPTCFGHTGFTGTALWVDPQHQLVAVLLTNRLQFGRDNERLHGIRRQFIDSLLAALR